jgi:Protein of unknown function (DUF3551)
MLKILLGVAALTAVVTLGPHPASAYGNGPWCAVVTTGWGFEERNCSFWSVEACVPHVIAGNRGFCDLNPDFRGSIPRSHRRSYRR